MDVTGWLLRFALRATALALLAGWPAAGRGQTVLFDFGNNQSYRGLSVPNPDPLGHYWNSLRTGVFYQNLVDINNNPTTIDFGFSTPVGTDSFNGPAGPTVEGDLQFSLQFTDVDQAALGNLGGALEGPFDFVAGPGLADNRVRFEIQQLDPAKKYNLTFFGSHKFSEDDVTVYSVFSDNTYTTLVGTASLEVQTPGSPNLHNRDKVATISNLSPQTDNILYVQFVGSNGNEGYLNDLQLAAITPGDYDGDGDVDTTDLGIWKGEFGDQGGGVAADGDGDGDVDGNDFLVWQRNVTGPAGGASAVPEPAGAALLLAALVGVRLVRRRGK
jgi:hypothetical protein